MKGLTSKGLIAAAGAVACLTGAPGAGAVTCDGTARAGASGAPELLTGCGRDDPGLGAGSLAATTLERLEPALGVKAATLDPVDASRGPAGRVIRLQQPRDIDQAHAVHFRPLFGAVPVCRAPGIELRCAIDLRPRRVPAGQSQLHLLGLESIKPEKQYGGLVVLQAFF